MKPEVVLEMLEAAAEQLHVRVSYEQLQTSVVHGGLCRVKGEHRIIVEAGDLPSGIYYYTLTAAGESVTRKLVLVR